MKSYSLLGVGLFSFIVGRLDNRDSDSNMELLRNQTRADMKAADLRIKLKSSVRIFAQVSLRISSIFKSEYILFSRPKINDVVNSPTPI